MVSARASPYFSQFVNRWSVSVHHMWDLPYATHKYFREPHGGQHMTITRYLKFIKYLQKSPKVAVKILVEKVLRNCNTRTGQNVRAEDIFKANVTKVRNGS